MPSTNPDDALLLIRCPQCSQRFKVGEDLRGLTVECGGCEHRFRINDEVIVRGQKFYPGERKDAKLNRFQRVPLAMSPEIAGVAAMRYSDAPDASAFEPVSPQRIIAGAIGVSGIAFMALLLMFGASRGGSLDGMTTDNRMLMAGFTGLLGSVLLVYANPRARFKAGAVGLLLSAGLLVVPWFFTIGSKPVPDVVAGAEAAASQASAVSSESEALADLRGQIGTAPLVAEIERLTRDGSTKHAVGLWLKGLSEQNRFLVRDYILRVTGADPQSHYYARDRGDFLMVVTGIDQTLEEMAKIAAVLGSLEQVYPELAVVAVRVNNENLVGGSLEKLTDKSDPAFYDLNKKELESIDLDRVRHAVQRLADAEPKIYRSDITRKLIALLGSPGVAFKGELCGALAVWSEQPGPAGDAALKEAQDLLARHKDVPTEIVALIVKEKNPAVIPIVDALWAQNPTRWEALYGETGPAAEATLQGRLANSDGMARHSAVRLLGRVGGAESLPLLEAAGVGANPEMKVLLAQAAASIRSRTEH